jgi:biopolymer transport protein ExbD
MINLRKKEKDDVHVYTEALNDIMFFLMLFFIFAALMKTDSAIKVNVPKAAQGQPITPSKNEVTLSVTKDATTGAIQYYFKDQAIDVAAIEAAILQEKTTHPEGETVVMIRMDKTIEYQIFVDMLSITSKTGVKSLAATQK